MVMMENKFAAYHTRAGKVCTDINRKHYEGPEGPRPFPQRNNGGRPQAYSRVCSNRDGGRHHAIGVAPVGFLPLIKSKDGQHETIERMAKMNRLKGQGPRQKII